MPVTQYKKAEKEFADRVGGSLRRAWSSLLAFFRLVVQKGRQRFTVMLIPHSEKKIFNFQISFFTLVFVTFTLSVVLVGFVVLATHFTATNEQFTQADKRSQEYAATLSSFKDEIAIIRKNSKAFKTNMDAVLGTIGSGAWTAAGQGGPLPAANEVIEEAAAGELREISELRGISRTLIAAGNGPIRLERPGAATPDVTRPVARATPVGRASTTPPSAPGHGRPVDRCPHRWCQRWYHTLMDKTTSLPARGVQDRDQTGRSATRRLGGRGHQGLDPERGRR